MTQISKPIAFIKAGWHSEIVDRALEGFHAEFARQGHAPERVRVFDVPGAFEIPLHAQTLARTGRFSCVVGAALIVDGGIYRHDFVATTVVSALMQIQLATSIPMMSVLLTPHDFTTKEREAFFFDHFIKKGEEAARACLQTVESLARLSA